MKLCHLMNVLLLVLYSATGWAQEIHRCGNLYSDTPCAQGYLVDFDRDIRTPEQKAQGDEVAAREKREALRMEQERTVQEAMAIPISRAIVPSNVALPSSQPGAEGPLPQPAKKKPRPRIKQREPDYLTVTLPTPPKKKESR